MDNQLLKILKSLKAIEPSPEFTKRSRAVILAASQTDSSFENYLIKILRPLRAIFAPHPDFTQKSRAIILSTLKPHQYLATLKNRIWDSVKYSAALGLASLLLLLAIGGLSYFNIRNLSPVILTSFNTQKLLSEVDGMDFQIKLAEARYYSQSAKEVAVALNEASRNGSGHLNSLILEKEINDLEIRESLDQEINRLLNEIIL